MSAKIHRMALQYRSTSADLLRQTHTHTHTRSRCSQTPPAVSARLSVDRCVIWEVRWAKRRFPVSSWHLPSKLTKHSLQLPCVCVCLCVCLFVCLYLNACTVVYSHILCGFLRKKYPGHISLPNHDLMIKITLALL